MRVVEIFVDWYIPVNVEALDTYITTSTGFVEFIEKCVAEAKTSSAEV